MLVPKIRAYQQNTWNKSVNSFCDRIRIVYDIGALENHS